MLQQRQPRLPRACRSDDDDDVPLFDEKARAKHAASLHATGMSDDDDDIPLFDEKARASTQRASMPRACHATGMSCHGHVMPRACRSKQVARLSENVEINTYIVFYFKLTYGADSRTANERDLRPLMSATQFQRAQLEALVESPTFGKTRSWPTS